jgi:serine protease inhibitor ecotin
LTAFDLFSAVVQQCGMLETQTLVWLGFLFFCGMLETQTLCGWFAFFLRYVGNPNYVWLGFLFFCGMLETQTLCGWVCFSSAVCDYN